MTNHYDLIVVGGGLSGLSAIREFQNCKVLLLEEAASIGGRVLTRQQHGVTYELGGFFAPNAEVFPESLYEKANRVPFSESIGVHYEGQALWGSKVVECLNGSHLTKEEKRSIRLFFQDKNHPADRLMEKPYNLLNAFFQLIHPGQLNQYVMDRKYDALIRWDLSFLKRGNCTVVDFLEEQSTAEIWTKARVENITDEGNLVRVEYIRKGMRYVVTSEKVIVTTPAPVAKKLLAHQNSACSDFLQALAYNGGFTLVLGIPTPLLKDFAFVATPDFEFTSVLHQKRENDISTLTIYFTGRGVDQLREQEMEVLVQDTLDDLQWVAATSLQRSDVIFYDSNYWPYISPVINDAYDLWNSRALKPSSNVQLAGDYTWYSPVDPLPYGMTAAYLSGQYAAKQVKKALWNTQHDYRGKYLLKTQIFHLAKNRPVYRGQNLEGDVAYYGILLAANKDKQLRDYLLDCAIDGLWEYQEDFGVTLDDSLLVMEGLWRAGWEEESLKYSLDQLIKFFYDSETGAFHTLSHKGAQQTGFARGRAKYWRGPGLVGTAQAAYLLSYFGQHYSTIIRRCQDYVAGHQHALGFWPSKWFPSVMWGTYYALELLLLDPDKYAAEIDKAKRFIINAQQGNGSWQEVVLETSFAIRSLKTLEYDEEHEYIKSGTDWLRSQIKHNQLSGEPLLYYWYEQDGVKLLHQARDNGKISYALAQLALEEKQVLAMYF